MEILRNINDVGQIIGIYDHDGTFWGFLATPVRIRAACLSGTGGWIKVTARMRLRVSGTSSSAKKLITP